MTTKQVIKTLGLKYNKANLFQVQKWAKTRTIKATKTTQGWNYDRASVLELKKHLDTKPQAYFTSREIAEMLDVGIYIVHRLVLRGKLTAWKTPGSPRSKAKFRKSIALQEIENILKSKNHD